MDTIPLIIIIICQFHLLPFIAKVQTQLVVPSCIPAANFTSGSIYDHNLNKTLTFLSSNAAVTGFATAITGPGPDSVYGLIQCAAYATRDQCDSCARTTTVQITQRCSNYKEAMVVYDTCVLRYSDKNFFSSSDAMFPTVMINRLNVSDPDGLDGLVGNLLKNISDTAASSPSRVSLNSTPYTNATDIYAMVQCVPTLNVRGCATCLEQIVGLSRQPNVCRPRGCTIISSSCILRYDLYSFDLVYLSHSINTDAATNSATAGKKNVKVTIIVVSSASAAIVVGMIFSALFGRRKFTKKEADVVHDSEQFSRRMEALMIGLSILKTATNNFSDAYKLGEGGFGSVYKGRLLDGQEIAVKRLSSNSTQGLDELRTEVTVVAKLMHQNLVKLVGFCLEDEEKLLVYEYLPNGSLDKILFDDNRRSSLKWETRYKIIVGIARGLLYLQEDCQPQIIHRDLKASNILLDEQMNPKISDFGLARLCYQTQTHQANTTRIAGTFGYIAPEYARNGNFSTKSDVYSFGMLVLEIVTGRKTSSFYNSTNLQTRAWKHWANSSALELLDPNLGDQWTQHEVMRCIQVGLLCVQDAYADRPTMSKVVRMLVGFAMTFPTPGRPAQYSLPSDEPTHGIVEEDPPSDYVDICIDL